MSQRTEGICRFCQRKAPDDGSLLYFSDGTACCVDPSACDFVQWVVHDAVLRTGLAFRWEAFEHAYQDAQAFRRKHLTDMLPSEETEFCVCFVLARWGYDGTVIMTMPGRWGTVAGEESRTPTDGPGLYLGDEFDEFARFRKRVRPV